MTLRATSILLLIIAFFGCDSDPKSTSDTGGSDAVVDTTSPDAVATDEVTPDSAVPSCEVEPTLTSLQAEYFNKSCSFSSCHGAGANPAGGLALTEGASYDALIDKDALFAPTKKLVVAGDPDNSFIVQKVEGPAAGEGGIMPVGAEEPLDPDCRIKALRDWIAAGAEDN